MQNSPSEIKEKLLSALDKDNNVVDMVAVLEIISVLEKTSITKEALEATRLGKYINDLRRKTTNESLAKRAKDLVRRWRDMIQPSPTIGPRANGRTGSVLGSGPLQSSRSLASGLPITNVGSTTHGTIGRSLHMSAMSPATSLPSSDGSASPAYPSSLSPRISTWGPSSQGSWSKTSRGHTPESPKCRNDLVPSSDPVPKTHAENKRFRKSPTLADGAPPNKRVRPNGQLPDPEKRLTCSPLPHHGESSRDSFGLGSDVSCEITSVYNKVPTVNEETKTIVKKRGRKKGSGKSNSSKASLSVPSVDDIVKEKIASIARTPKVKTTQELLEGLQAKTTGNDDIVGLNISGFEDRNKSTSLINCVLPTRSRTSYDDVTRNKTEHIAKFLKSQSEVEILEDDPINVVDDGSCDAIENPPQVSTTQDSNIRERTCPPVKSENTRSRDDSVESILARLPPIDACKINLEDSESESSEYNVLCKETIDSQIKKLHTEHIEGINGNVSDGRKLRDDDDSFREWQEVVSKNSYQGELLHILPYVIID